MRSGKYSVPASFEKAADVSADERAGHVGALEEMVWEMEESV